jgi:hypothetical protein
MGISRLSPSEGAEEDTWSFEGGKWKWQGVEENAGAAVVPFVMFTGRCDGDEHFKGADRLELYLNIQSVPRSKHPPTRL